jgi:hypothetical protein
LTFFDRRIEREGSALAESHLLFSSYISHN